MTILRILGWWFLLSVPLGMLVGRLLRRRGPDDPQGAATGGGIVSTEPDLRTIAEICGLYGEEVLAALRARDEWWARAVRAQQKRAELAEDEIRRLQGIVDAGEVA